MRVFDLVAAATVVDIGRHQAEINFGHTATRPHGLIDMSSFQTSPIKQTLWEKSFFAGLGFIKKATCFKMEELCTED